VVLVGQCLDVGDAVVVRLTRPDPLAAAILFGSRQDPLLDSGGELDLGFGHEPVEARYDVGGAASVERIGSQGDANLSHHGRGVQVVAHDVADRDVCRHRTARGCQACPRGVAQ
jgi:hypothetical protein